MNVVTDTLDPVFYDNESPIARRDRFSAILYTANCVTFDARSKELPYIYDAVHTALHYLFARLAPSIALYIIYLSPFFFLSLSFFLFLFLLLLLLVLLYIGQNRLRMGVVRLADISRAQYPTICFHPMMRSPSFYISIFFFF
jgi:hypothetical protein